MTQISKHKKYLKFSKKFSRIITLLNSLIKFFLKNVEIKSNIASKYILNIIPRKKIINIVSD